jgi:aspartyl-tRNA(Asn)/glutamyl-tRNA(Gln) amidotransferase subunit B
LRHFGDSELGSKVEVKNMNSFRAVYNALHSEVVRQTAELDAGRRIPQETRGWVDADATTVSQRSKEQAHDYRYFPEPDLPPVTIDAAYIERVRAKLPELPDAKQARFERDFGLPVYDAHLLVETEARADYYERALAPANGKDDATRKRYARQISNWMTGDFARLLHASDMEITDARIAPEALYAMIALVEEGTITGKIAKTVFEEMFSSGREPAAIIKDLGLEQISGTDEIGGIVDRVLEANPRAVEDFRAGKQEAIKFLVGQAMRETRGRANPATLTEILQAKLGS